MSVRIFGGKVMNKTFTEKRNIIAILIVAAVMLASMIMLASDIIYAAGSGEVQVENSEDLSITVIEDDNVMDDSAVPLAAGPSDNNFAVHAVLSGVLLAVCVFYAIYFRRYQKKIFALRKKLAEAEHKAMRN